MFQKWHLHIYIYIFLQRWESVLFLKIILNNRFLMQYVELQCWSFQSTCSSKMGGQKKYSSLLSFLVSATDGKYIVTSYLAVAERSVFTVIYFTYPRRPHIIESSQAEKQTLSCLCLLLCLQSAYLQCKGLMFLAEDTALPFCFSTSFFTEEAQAARFSPLLFIATIHNFKNLPSVVTQRQIQDLLQANERTSCGDSWATQQKKVLGAQNR